MRTRSIVALCAAGLTVAACSSTTTTAPTTVAAASTTVRSTAAPTIAATTSTAPAPATTSAATPLAPATFTVQPGTEQIAVLGAAPDTALTVVDGRGSAAATGRVDAQGSLLFRNLAPGSGYTVRSATEASATVAVAGADAAPPSGLYADQPKLPAGGFGYITTRDGTTLSANVVLPGPADEGPYPTVVEYSGYQPSDPGSATFAQIFTTLGFAYVGVNMRGSGCSGGSYRFFETVQSLDGYDAIEAVAAQPWVMDHRVGMVGISYPGISQLFVAATRPPSLEAIAPLSVLDDSYRSTLYPGGILNTGFAVDWISARLDETRPFGQQWAEQRADGGDTECAANQKLRLQNPDLLAEIRANPFDSPELGDPLAPATFVDRIDVPVFIAGAWQDEQTGGHFPAMLPGFTASPHVFVTLMNGVHTESLSPPVFGRMVEFLDLYVAKKVPDLTSAGVIAPVLGATLYGVKDFPEFDDRFTGMTYAQALAAFEGEPAVRILFEQGGARGLTPGTPEPNFSATFSAWPISEATATTWFVTSGGQLTDVAPPDTVIDPVAEYTADPTDVPPTFFPGGGSGVWKAGALFDWRQIPDGTGAGFVTAPLVADTVIAGSGSADLWVQTAVPDTDLEVSVSEVRPDGKEIYVQSGWLRASHRALDDSKSTALRPVQTHLRVDAAPLPAAEPTLLRVELFPFAHPFRAGSRLRLTVHAPGNNRAQWQFETIDEGEQIQIVSDAAHPSKLVLAVVPPSAMAGVVVPPAPPACGSLRGQPCRDYVPAANGG